MSKISQKSQASSRLEKRGLTPKGVGPLFSGNPTFRRKVAGELLDIFKQRGYREIALPAFEYLDALRPGIDPALLEKAYTIQDRTSGHVLILRPDATAQIARLLAHAIESGFDDLRFSYNTTVFRHEDHHVLERELFQVGVEYWGNGSVWGDWEIIHLCLQGARKLAIWDPTLVLSHHGLQTSILDLIGMIAPEASRQEISRIFYAHDSGSLLQIIREGGNKKALSDRKTKVFSETLIFLLRNVVSLPEAISSLEALLSCLPHDRIDESFLSLVKEWTYGPSEIVLDLALAPVGPYYSGMFFHLYTPGSTREIASGGRYDKLPALFGANIPATGFAFHLNRIDDSTSMGQEVRDQGEIHFIVQPEDSGSYHLIEKLIFSLTQNRQPVRILYPQDFPGDKELQALDPSYFEKFPNVSEVILKKGDDFISFLKNGSFHTIFRTDYTPSIEDPFLDQGHHPTLS